MQCTQCTRLSLQASSPGPQTCQHNCPLTFLLPPHPCTLRYSKYYGIIYKNATTGMWWTWISNTVKWPGADDWSTGYSECKRLTTTMLLGLYFDSWPTACG